jgi:tripartite-type tricarboxylate transporter receptor subunit TctC
MKNIFAYVLLMLFSIAAQAKEDIPVITRFDPTTGSYQALLIWTKEMSSIHPEYNFVLQNVLGAQGENADRRVISLARSGQKLIWFGSSVSFTNNRFLFTENAWDRNKDILPLKGFSISNQILFVNRKRISSIEEFKKLITSNKTVYFGSTINGGGGDVLNDLVVKHYKLENIIKEIKYKNAGEIVTALVNGEIDYTILSQGYIRLSDINPLMISAKKRSDHQLLSQIPTGKELGIDKFVFGAQAFFGIPKELQDFGKSLVPYIERVCDNEQIKELKSKTGQSSNCDNPDVILQNIKEELELVSPMYSK